MTPMEHRARVELLSAYRAYLRNLSRAWEAPATEWSAGLASADLQQVESLVYVLTGRSRHVRRVPTPTTRRVAA